MHPNGLGSVHGLRVGSSVLLLARLRVPSSLQDILRRLVINCRAVCFYNVTEESVSNQSFLGLNLSPKNALVRLEHHFLSVFFLAKYRI